MGRAVRRQKRADAEGRPPQARISSWPASATTTTCAKSCSARTASSPASRKGAIVVDHTTASAEIARELHAEAKKRGFDFIDAPVSGGQAGAENGVLTVMCGGDAAPFAQAEKSSPRMRAPAI